MPRKKGLKKVQRMKSLNGRFEVIKGKVFV